MTRPASLLRWTGDELAILHAYYERRGCAACAKRLPGRTPGSIHQKAFKLGLKTRFTPPAPRAKLEGANLEEAIRLRDEGWSFARIGELFGASESSASNAVIIARCRREGFRAAERDSAGRFTEAGIERIRELLRKGLKARDIQLRLGVSAERVAEERRRYSADLKARGKRQLPRPGNGEAYSGAAVPGQKRKEVEELFLSGLGAPKVSARTGVSRTTCRRIRAKLIRRLKRRGEALPGCDKKGRRIEVIGHRARLPAESVEHLKWMLLDRVPVARAARILGIGASSAYRIRDELKAELAARGETLPSPILPGRGHDGRAEARKAAWLPASRHMFRFRALVHDHGEGEARRLMKAELEAERRDVALAAREAARQPLSFEEQLARVRAGARIVGKFEPRAAAPDVTLGGVSAGML